MTELINQNVIKQMMDDLGEETCLRLIQLFIDEMTDLNNKLITAFKCENFETIADITHIIKNSAALYGAMALSAKSIEINDRLTILNQPLLEGDNKILLLMENTLSEYKAKYK